MLLQTYPCLVQLQIQNNIGPLINTVVATNKFEREMATLFGGSSGVDDDVS